MENKGNKITDLFGGKGVIVSITEDTEPSVDDNRANLILDPIGIGQSLQSRIEQHYNLLSVERLMRDVMAMRILNPTKSRNKREGRYSFPATFHPGEPAMFSLVESHRKRGLKSRRIYLNTAVREYRKKEFLAGRDPSKSHTVFVKIVHVS